jgi:predicted nucleic acid-binding protein
VLVAELLRERGRVLLAHPRLRVVVAEDQWEETEHELARRLALITEQGRITAEQARALGEAISALVAHRVIEVIPRPAYEHLEATARRRVPRDPRDWAPVALALALDAAILTGDGDFLGCGVPTWTVETLRAELDNADTNPPPPEAGQDEV